MRSRNKGNPKSNHHRLGSIRSHPISCTQLAAVPRTSHIVKCNPALIVTGVHNLAGFHRLMNGVLASFDLTNFNLATLTDRWAIGGLLTLLFAALGRWVRGVTNGGALAGAVCCFFLYLGGGPGAFAALITVFALAWITTRLGYQHKQRLGIAERREGRDASQVLANLGVATVCAGIYALDHGKFAHGKIVWLLAMSAALSEAAADTVSSEVGQALGEKARLITNWKTVPAGTNGAITLTGTLAGIASAAIVSSVCLLGGLVSLHWLPISVGAALLGMIMDSFLGAWLERRGLLNNNSVNFLSTLVTAVASSWLI
jgi:uncharacterized protein (TIGR00297 family)